jgi:hypothetical protein
MNKIFTWTVLCAISVQPSSIVLRANSPSPKTSQNNPSKQPSSLELQKEIEVISLQHFFLTPHTDQLTTQPKPSDTNAPTVVSAEERSDLSLEQGDTVFATNVAVPSKQTEDIQELASLPSDAVSEEIFSSTQEQAPSIQETVSDNTLTAAPEQAEPLQEVDLQVQAEVASLPSEAASEEIFSSTQEQAPSIQETVSDNTLTAAPEQAETLQEGDLQVLPEVPTLPNAVTASADRMIPSQEIPFHHVGEIAVVPTEQKLLIEFALANPPVETSASAPFVVQEETNTCQVPSLDSSPSEPTTFILDTAIEDTHIELISTDETKNNPEICNTTVGNQIAPKNQGTLFSKVVIGTVSTAVVLVSIILGSK